MDDNNQDDFQTNPTDLGNPMQDMTDDQKLPSDDSTPFSPPDDIAKTINDTHPSTDTGIDEDESYNSGAEIASGFIPPSDSDVTQFTSPDNDTDKDDAGQ